MPLFQLRRRLAQRAEAAARGEPWPLVDRFSDEARHKIGIAMMTNAPVTASNATVFFEITPGRVNQAIQRRLEEDWGKPIYRGDVFAQLGVASDEQVVDIVEAWGPAIDPLVEAFERDNNLRTVRDAWRDQRATFRERINEILDHHDIAWVMVGDELMPRQSEAMHATIVAPVLSLGIGDRRYAATEAAFTKALREMKPGGDPIDAITAVGTALQLALESAGAKGQNLGQLVTSATSRKILVDRDSPLADGIAAIVTWAREQRNQRGSTHQVESVSASEAWLTVRVAGALILRIVKA